MQRPFISGPLNLAEGVYSRGKNRQVRFQSAAASARETPACLETAEAMGFIGPLDAELSALFHRVVGTLVPATTLTKAEAHPPSRKNCGDPRTRDLRLRRRFV
jgi:hypothetical protein